MPGISDVLAQGIVSEIGVDMSRFPAAAPLVSWAASMLTAAYCMMRDNVDDRDLGADHLDRTDRRRAARRLVRKLGDLGFHVY